MVCAFDENLMVLAFTAKDLHFGNDDVIKQTVIWPSFGKLGGKRYSHTFQVKITFHIVFKPYALSNPSETFYNMQAFFN